MRSIGGKVATVLKLAWGNERKSELALLRVGTRASGRSSPSCGHSIRFIVFWLGLCVALSLVGCGESENQTASSPTASSGKSSKLPELLATTTNAAVFIRWRRLGAQVQGVLSETKVDLSDSTKLESVRASFTGTITGTSVDLDLEAPISSGWTGILKGERLTLRFELRGGSMVTLDFAPGSAADYKAAVAQLRNRCLCATAGSQP